MPKSADRCAQRRDRLASRCRSVPADAFLVSEPINVSYLTGFRGDSSQLLVGQKWCVLLSDSRFPEQIEEECPGLEYSIRLPGEAMPQAIAKALTKAKVRRLAFESAVVSVAQFEKLRELAPAVEWQPRADDIEEMRAIKDPDEVRQIREAIGFAERAFDMFRAMLTPKDDEKSLADALEGYLRRAGARCSAFPPIVAAGARSALPHAIPEVGRRVGDGDLLLVDWGARGDFYHSDLTRMFFRRGIGKKLAKVFEVVAKARQAGIESVRPGVLAKEVDAAARKVITDAGFGRAFSHSLGHGIGLAVHEEPGLRITGETPLRQGMVVTIEPGIYLKGLGGVRLEDDVLVTADGHEVLSTAPGSNVPLELPS